MVAGAIALGIIVISLIPAQAVVIEPGRRRLRIPLGVGNQVIAQANVAEVNVGARVRRLINRLFKLKIGIIDAKRIVTELVGGLIQRDGDGLLRWRFQIK